MKTIKKTNKMLKKYSEFTIDEKINIKSDYKILFINNSLHYDFCFDYDFNYANCKSGSKYKNHREKRNPNHAAIKAKRRRMARKAWERSLPKDVVSLVACGINYLFDYLKENLKKN